MASKRCLGTNEKQAESFPLTINAKLSIFLLSIAGVERPELCCHWLPLLAASMSSGSWLSDGMHICYSEQHRLSSPYLVYYVTSEVPHGWTPGNILLAFTINDLEGRICERGNLRCDKLGLGLGSRSKQWKSLTKSWLLTSKMNCLASTKWGAAYLTGTIHKWTGLVQKHNQKTECEVFTGSECLSTCQKLLAKPVISPSLSASLCRWSNFWQWSSSQFPFLGMQYMCGELNPAGLCILISTQDGNSANYFRFSFVR